MNNFLRPDLAAKGHGGAGWGWDAEDIPDSNQKLFVFVCFCFFTTNVEDTLETGSLAD